MDISQEQITIESTQPIAPIVATKTVLVDILMWFQRRAIYDGVEVFNLEEIKGVINYKIRHPDDDLMSDFWNQSTNKERQAKLTKENEK